MTGSASTDEIAALIGDLSDSSYETRAFATRRLCAVGMPARAMLETAVDGSDVEAGLRARAVLRILDGLMFAGVDLRLSFSRVKTAWDQPVDLNITMVNRSDYSARVPFELDPARRASESADARQVGDIIDLAEFLHVRRADGSEIELTVDDIATDPAVVAAVQQRLNGGPISTLQPGEQVTLTARLFNRGWGRYRLLDASTYTVKMEYLPDWNDEVLASSRVGRVVSNVATITVTRGAPRNVSRGGSKASISLHREGDSISARLTNKTDQVMLINKNFGRSPPFATGRWVWERDGAFREVPLIPKATVSWHDFDAALLIEAAAGETVELARIGLEDLRRQLLDAGADLAGKRWEVYFAYNNVCDRKWQDMQGSALLGNSNAPVIFQRRLSRRILSARHNSDRLKAPQSD